MYSGYIVFLLIIILVLFLNKNDNIHYFNILRKKKRGNKMLPKELMQKFVGKVCSILNFNAISPYNGKIVSIEDNWLLIEGKPNKKGEKETKLVNGDIISQITVLPDNYQY